MLCSNKVGNHCEIQSEGVRRNMQLSPTCTVLKIMFSCSASESTFRHVFSNEYRSHQYRWLAHVMFQQGWESQCLSCDMVRAVQVGNVMALGLPLDSLCSPSCPAGVVCASSSMTRGVCAGTVLFSWTRTWCTECRHQAYAQKAVHAIRLCGSWHSHQGDQAPHAALQSLNGVHQQALARQLGWNQF